MKSNIRGIEPVLPSNDIKRDLNWYEKYTGFTYQFGDEHYVGMVREDLCIHLQWHADTNVDPVLGGSVIKIFVYDLTPFFDEFVKRGTIKAEKLQNNTPWGTNEFGFYDLNGNAIYFVQSL